jgi:hypothetical protein
MQIELAERAQHGGIEQAEALANDARQQLLLLANAISSIVCIILFLMWVYRTNRNLRPLGVRGIEFTPGWSVGWWFVPIANIVRPYQIVKEIYLASDPLVALPRGIQRRGAPPVVRGWWGCWVAGYIINRVVTRGEAPTSPAELISLSYGVSISSALHVVAGILAIVLVARIDRRQDQRYDRLADGSLAIPAEPAVVVPDIQLT